MMRVLMSRFSWRCRRLWQLFASLAFPRLHTPGDSLDRRHRQSQRGPGTDPRHPGLMLPIKEVLPFCESLECPGVPGRNAGDGVTEPRDTGISAICHGRGPKEERK